MEVPGRIEMRAVVGRELHLFDRPALPVREILGLQTLEELQHARQALLVIDVLDGRVSARWIGRHVVLQGYGDVDQLARHGVFPVFLFTPIVASLANIFSRLATSSAMPSCSRIFAT